MRKTLVRRLLDKGLTARHYLLGLLGLLLSFMLFHALTYQFYTSKVINIDAPYTVGDLGRMSYQTGSVYRRELKFDLPARHIEGSEYDGGEIDLITIGDSFSNGGGGGKNSYYQDFIASQYGLKVLNIVDFRPYKNRYVQIALALESSGMLDTMKPKAILIETGGRAVIERFVEPMEWEVDFSREQMLSQLKQMKGNDIFAGLPSDVFFINTGNYKHFTNRIRYLSKPCLSNLVCRMKLTQPFFSVDEEDTLLFYREDLRDIPTITPIAVKRVNDNFNRLAEQLAKRGIRLYVMPIVDKYDLYSPFLTDAASQKNPLFELLRPLEKRYTFIDTKAILSPLVAAGEKDIFFADDTHWNHKAAEAVVRHTPFDELSRNRNSAE